MTSTEATVTNARGETAQLDTPQARDVLRHAIGDAHGINPDTGELFDPQPYDLPIPKLDGHRADTLKLQFTGSPAIDVHDADGLEFFTGLRFGREITLTVTATVGKTGWALKTNTDGEETVTHTVTLAVSSYDIP